MLLTSPGDQVLVSKSIVFGIEDITNDDNEYAQGNQIDISLNGTRIQCRNIHGTEPTIGYRIIPCQGI